MKILTTIQVIMYEKDEVFNNALMPLSPNWVYPTHVKLLDIDNRDNYNIPVTRENKIRIMLSKEKQICWHEHKKSTIFQVSIFPRCKPPL